MLRYVVFISTLLSVASWAYADTIDSIVFEGNYRIPSHELLRLVTAAPNPMTEMFANRAAALVAVQSIESRVTNYYRRLGYLFAEIDSVQLLGVSSTDSLHHYKLVLRIAEGLDYVVDTIRWTGLISIDSEWVAEQVAPLSEKPLDESMLKECIANVLGRYSQMGRPLAKISVESITLDTIVGKGGLNIAMTVSEGRKARIGKVVIDGNATTQRDVVLRELRIEPGSWFNPPALNSGRERLLRLGYFESVSDPDLFLLTDSTVGVVFHVVEAKTSVIDGIIGYNPPQSTGGSGYISGMLDLGFRNIAGTGRDASLHYLRQDALSEELNVAYLEPWLFGFPVSLGLEYHQRQQDSSFTQSSANATLTLQMRADLSISALGGFVRVIPTDLPNYPFTAFNSNALVTGLSALLDTRDDPYAPRSGILGSLSASYSSKSIYGPARFIDSSVSATQGIRTLGLDVSLFQPLTSPNFVSVVSLHARSVEPASGMLDDADLVRLGGIKSIRGYREGELLASRFLYGSLEARAMTGDESFVFAFMDGGQLVREPTFSNPTEQVLTVLSYGIGIQLDSQLGLISVSLALPSSEPLAQTKLHFGLVKPF